MTSREYADRLEHMTALAFKAAAPGATMGTAREFVRLFRDYVIAHLAVEHVAVSVERELNELEQEDADV